ncbi:hypothetical protein [uncultured Bradyrhizobium sp.]|uniref:hypothetical protein n=1 Tax=uncultured Bradyrhizobium sp. TaxID=199684 RepID=UPI0035CC9059
MNQPPEHFGQEPERRVSFGDRLAGLCAIELSAAKGDPDRAAAMIERLLNSLAFTIAVASRGDPKGIGEMLQGAESYLYEAAADHQKVAGALEGLQRS